MSETKTKRNKPVKSVTAEEGILQFARTLLSNLSKEKEISQGMFYIAEKEGKKHVLRLLTAYAWDSPDTEPRKFEFGEGFPGQVAKDGELMNLSDVPDGYVSIVSGLGHANPASLMIFPVMTGKKVLAVVELASFHRFTGEDENYFRELSLSLAEQMKILNENI